MEESAGIGVRMAIFKYIAKDGEGKTKKGAVEAGSKERAAAVMQERGLVPVSIIAQRQVLDIKALIGRLRGVSDKEVVAFTRQLATMIGAGLPLSQTLTILRDQAEETPFGDILEYVLGEVQGGKPLSEAMRRFPKVFSPTYTALVEAAEASGALKNVLLRLADNLEKRGKLISKIKSALFYPAMILAAMTGVGVLLLVFVVPNLKVMYESFEAELPFVTRIFLGLSDFLVGRWWAAILIAGGLFYTGRWFKRTERGEYFWAELFLKLPIFGSLLKQLELVEMTRTLSLLLVSGVPILDALRITAGSANNVLYRDVLEAARGVVEHGESLATPIAASGYFPPIVSRMIRVGEESGEMGSVLLKLSDYFEGEAEHRTANLTTAIEPLVMIVLGAGVGFMVLSIIMPIYNLTGQF